MKNFHHKIVCSFLLFCFAAATLAQSPSYSTLSKELQLLQKQLVPDKRVAVLEVEMKDTLQPMVVVFGETDLPEAKSQIIHGYDKISDDLIWSIVINHLPKLKIEVTVLLDR